MSENSLQFRADLHCHTTCSDGSLSPEEVIALAHERGLGGLSITDHDSIDAYPAAFEKAEKNGLILIPGVEFSTVHMGMSIHVLAYSFPTDSSAIQSFCSQHQARRTSRIEEMLSLLRKQNMPILEEELYFDRPSKRGIGRPHLAQQMVKKGYVKDNNEAFKRYLGEGKPCYVFGKPNSAEETLRIIHEAKGFAVLAHPHLIDKPEVLKSLLKMPFDGIECYYARFSKAQNKRWLEIAQHKGWLVLGGSDFHGAMKPAISLGCAWAPEDTFHILKQRFQQNCQ